MGERAAAVDQVLAAMRAQVAAVRRLRAILRAVRDVFDADEVARLRGELRWLGSTLGAARDADVLRGHLRGPFEALGRIDPATVRRLRRRLDTERTRARARVVAALASPRYRALLDDLDAVTRSRPPAAADRALA